MNVLFDSGGSSRVGGSETHPLSIVQQGMLLQRLKTGRTQLDTLHVTGVLRHEVDVAALEHAWNSVVEHEPLLRTVFLYSDVDELFQRVLEEVPKISVQYQGLSAMSLSEQEVTLAASEREQLDLGFDIREFPLVRMLLFRLAPRVYKLFLYTHHLLVDGDAVTLLFKCTFAAYAFACGNSAPEWPAVQPFHAYVEWGNSLDKSSAQSYLRKKCARVHAIHSLRHALENRAHAIPRMYRIMLSAKQVRAHWRKRKSWKVPWNGTFVLRHNWKLEPVAIAAASQS